MPANVLEQAILILNTYSDAAQFQKAIGILKGEFRGGDPELLQQKKEEKRQELEDEGEGDSISQAIHVLKGDAGQEEGTFRGGDPELLQQKREEKRQEMEAQGPPEDEGGDEPDPADVEEANLKQQDKQEAAGKAFPFGITEAGNEVSPVDTLEDYRSRDSNGDPWDVNNKYPDQKYLEPGPPRRGPNQWKPWSEVVGFKVPPEGAPWQHLRRYILSGEPPEVVQHEAKLLVRSLVVELVKGLEAHPEFDQEVHDAFFSLYDNLNRGLCWEPNFNIYKADKGEVVPGHKYVYRWMGDNNKWEYQYSGGIHNANHGVEHTGNRQGHTVEVHPEWESQDPGHTNPEGAFHHARAKVMEEGGQFPIKVMNPNTLQHENKILKVKGSKKRELAGKEPLDQPIEIHDESGKATPSRLKGFKEFEEYIRTHHVNTEHDIHGNPWIQWMDETPGEKPKRQEFEPEPFKEEKEEHPEKRAKRLEKHTKKQEEKRLAHEKKGEEGRVRMRYFPGTKYPGSTPKKTDKSGFHPGPSSVAALKDRIAKERKSQLIEAGHPLEQKKKFDLLSDKPFTDKIQSGGVARKLVDMPFQRKGETLHGTRKVWRAQWKNGKERDTVVHGLMEEHEGLARKIAKDLVSQAATRYAGVQHFSEHDKKKIADDLVTISLTSAMNRAVNNYDHTEGTKFSTYIHRIVRAEQKSELERTIRQHVDGLGGTGGDVGERKMDAVDQADSSAPTSSEQVSMPDWLNATRDHVDNVYNKWEHENMSAHPDDKKDMYKQFNDAHEKLSQMGDSGSEDPDEYTKFLNDNNMHGMFYAHVPGDDNAEALSDHMRREASPPKSKESTEAAHGSVVHMALKDLDLKHGELKRRIQKEGMTTVHDLMTSLQKKPFDRYLPEEIADEANKEFTDKVNAKQKELSKQGVSKAMPQPQQPAQPDVTYMGKQGEPGAPRFFYQTGDVGNIVEGTNAPVGHEDHVPQFGSPQIHPNEPTPEMNPDMFDQQGRKLDRPIPEGVEAEDNANYNPDKAQGNYWIKRYPDPSTGENQYVYLHRDHASDPKMQNNLAIKYLDVQLPKIREWYQSLLRSQEVTERALGLFVALLDQGRIGSQYLEDVKVGNVKLSGNVASFTLPGGSVKVALDPETKQCLEELMEGKDKSQPLFVLEGNRLDTVTLNRFFNEKFGVLPSAFITYHATKDFSEEFQNLVSRGKSTGSPIDFLMAVKDQILHKLANEYAMNPDELASKIDVVALEASIMAAHLNGMSKSDKKELQDKYVFQGLPISIENRSGTWRTLHDQMGQTKMLYDYGYIRHTTGMDGDHVDVYIGPNPNANTAFVIHQMKAPEFDRFDEDKVMLGFDSEKDAKEAYLKQYTNPKFYGGCTALPMRKLKKKIFDTKDNPHMIKSIRIVSANVPAKSADEEDFSQWVHSYPVHEHELHWQALTQHHERQKADDQQKKQEEFERPQGLERKTFDPAEFGVAQ